MTTATLNKLCAGRCGALIPSYYRAPSRCSNCTREKQIAYDQTRGTAAERGYGARWRKYRAWFLAKWRTCGSRPKDAPQTNDSRCQAEGRIVAAAVVDHIVPVTGPHDPAFFQPKAQQALCDPCHQAKRQRESQR